MNRPHSITDTIMKITGSLPKAKFRKSPKRVMIPFSEPTYTTLIQDSRAIADTAISP